MDSKMKGLIDTTYTNSLNGERIERSVLKTFLELDPTSEEAELLGAAARRMARAVNNYGKVWSAVGVDYRPCRMNCEFCSFGEKWGVMQKDHELSDEEVIRSVKNFVNQGAHWVTLRTTEFFDLERLCALAKSIRKEVCGEYELVVNTGEFDARMANHFTESGIDVIYHTLRLGEGVATPFDPQERIRTIQAIRDSSAKLAYLIEPVGAEHTNDEILDVLEVGLENNAKLCGAMARVNIINTPFYGTEEISEDRLAQIVAVSRLAGGIKVPEICVHPPSLKALRWGANVMVVEKGAIPRHESECCNEWQDFRITDAKRLFQEAGYTI